MKKSQPTKENALNIFKKIFKKKLQFDLKVKEEFYFCVQNVTKLKCDEKVHFHQKNLLPKILDIKSTVFNPANNAMIRYLTEYNNNNVKS